MKRVFRYLRRYIFRLIIGSIIKIIGTLVELIIPLLLAYVIDNVIPLGDVKLVLFYGGMMFICCIIALFGNIKANQMSTYVTKNVTRDLRHDLFVKIQSLSAEQFDQISIPSLISRMTSDTYNVHQMVGMMQRIGIRAPILLIGGIVITLTLDPVLTLILIATLPLLTLVISVISKKGIPLYTNVQMALDTMVRTIRENISGIRVIKALSKEDYEKERFAKINQKVIDYELKSGYTMARLNPIINLLLNFGLVGVIVVGAYRVNEGAILGGKVLAFTTYFTIILNAMLSITRIFMVFSRAAASATRINYVMNIKETLLLEEHDKIETDYQIIFDNVNFSYNKKINNLTNISFCLRKGESLGIIGSTGSGKTTIINLLMRFYDFDSGHIYINGEDIRSIDPYTLKKMFGVVFQNDTIFSNTILENICFGREVSKDDLDLAIKVAQAEDFISNQINGLETQIASRGTNLSGGQKQRLLIARALVVKPAILILDDASSALDYQTDANLRQGLKKYYDNTTQIIVTQRVSQAMNCDHILIIDDGNEVAYGTHEELIESVKLYQELYQLQMGGGEDEF